MTSERVMVAVTRQDILLKREDLEEDSSPEDFLASIVSEFGKTDKKVMAVGHNPFISRLASLLLAGSKSYMLEEFKTGTLLVTDSIGSGKMWSLRFYMPSKLLAEFHNSYLNLIAQKTSH
jgi:phosphohistidine phosphatase SixA